MLCSLALFASSWRRLILKLGSEHEDEEEQKVVELWESSATSEGNLLFNFFIFSRLHTNRESIFRKNAHNKDEGKEEEA